MKIKITIWLLLACIIIPTVSVLAIRQVEVFSLKNTIDQKEAINKKYLETIDDLNNEINEAKEGPLFRGVWKRITPVVGWDDVNWTIHSQFPETIIINSDSTAVLIFDIGVVETYYSSLWNYGGLIFLDKNDVQVRTYTLDFSDEEPQEPYKKIIEIETRLPSFPVILYGQKEDYYSL